MPEFHLSSREDLFRRIVVARKLLEKATYGLFFILIFFHPDWSSHGPLNDYLEGRYLDQVEFLSDVQNAMARLAEDRPILNGIVQFNRVGAEIAIIVAGKLVFALYALFVLVSLWAGTRLAHAAAAQQGVAFPTLVTAKRRIPVRGYVSLTVMYLGIWALYMWVTHPETCVTSGRTLFTCTSILPTILAAFIVMSAVLELVWNRFNSQPSRIDKILAVFD